MAQGYQRACAPQRACACDSAYPEITPNQALTRANAGEYAYPHKHETKM
jgi:hypothetical protein